MARGRDGVPVPGAEVAILDGDISIDRTTTTEGDGSFQFRELPPGTYQLTAKLDGVAVSRITSVEVRAGESVHVDLSLVADADQSASTTQNLTAPASGGAALASAPVLPTATFHGNFFQRFGEAYLFDWKGTTPTSVELPSERRQGIYPAPVDGPPFPFADWPIGGTVWIGAPWTQSSPFMQALWSGPHGDWWKKSGIQFYGWLNFGANWSTSHSIDGGNDPGKYANAPAAYAIVPNAIEPDQEVVYIEREPDTVQTEHFDWGFRLANLWGLDYRFTTSKGVFSSQLLGTNAAGCPNGSCSEYGDDLVMAYVDLYFPHVGQGTDVRIGRYISLPDIEAQLAPNNYSYSHSLLYTYDCYTQTGIVSTTRLSNHWKIQVGFSPGCDAAPWTRDAKPTINGCIQYDWRLGLDELYLCDNETNLTHNTGQYAYNNLQAYYLTWYHKLSKNWHTDTESWYQWEKNVPDVNPSAPTNVLAEAAPLLETNANGAWCSPSSPGVYPITCYAPEWAIVNYLEYQIGPHNYISIRNEYFDDIKGQRTGYKDQYSEHMFNWGHWVGTTILLRPEVNYGHAYENPAYQVGTKKSQLMLAGDVIWFF